MSISLFARRAAVVLLLMPAMVGGNERGTPPSRIFHLDLQTLGAVNLESSRPGNIGERTAPLPPVSVSFVDSATLAVSFPVFNSRNVLSTRDVPQGGTRLFHTAVIDLNSTRVKAERSWGTAYLGDMVLSLSGGRFLVRSGSKLGVFSTDWVEERSYQLADPDSRTVTSSTGRTLFVITKVGEHQEDVEVLAAATLERMHAFAIESIGLDAVSDSYFAYLLPAKRGYAIFVLPLDLLGKGALPPRPPVYLPKEDGCNRPYFVKDDLLLLAGNCDALTLIRADGTLELERHLGATFFVFNVHTSQDQQRFAVDVAAGAVPTKTEGMPDPIRVYDTTALTTVASDVDLAPPSAERLPRLAFTLSGDGSRLAVLWGFDLSVYQLPRPLAVVFPPGTKAQAPGAPASTASPQASSADPATGGSVAGTDTDKSSDFQGGMQVQVQHSSDIDVSISLSDLRRDAIRAWVQISNRGATDVALAPEKATLEILSPGQKMLRAMNPDKLATAIQRVGEDDAEHERYGCELPGEPGAPSECAKARESAFQIQQASEATAADVRSSALRAQVVKPGEQVQGAIFFTYQKKRGESVLRLPVGDQVFEFHLPPKAK